MFEPLAGRREVLVTEQRTTVDDAAAIQHLVDISSPNAEKIVLMQDNLHTQNLASLYEAFPAEAARRLIDKLAVPCTPMHGSWLNMAEIEWGGGDSASTAASQTSPWEQATLRPGNATVTRRR